MKSWFESEGAAAASPEEFVPFTGAADEFVAFSSESQSEPGAAGGGRDEATPGDEVLEAQLAKAYARGLADARAERSEAESGEAARAFGVLDAAASEISGWLRRESSQWSRAVIDLALLVAERTVRGQIAVDRDALQSRIVAAIESVAEENGARLFVAPADLSWIAEPLESEIAVLREVRALEIEADPALEAGEFRVEHRGSIVDGRVEAMLARFREELADFSLERGGEA